jgi:phosphohistidine phosphatase
MSTEHPRRLVLIRHAKAGDGLTDHERPLADRGRRDADRIGRWLQAGGFSPDGAIVSTALRARQTWQGLAGELQDAPTPNFDNRIYDNTVDDLLDLVHLVDDGVTTLALVGHNPAMQELTIHLDGSHGTSELGRAVRGHFPTSAVVVVDVQTAWAHLGGSDGAIAAFATPLDF